jgi:hypothetical protein
MVPPSRTVKVHFTGKDIGLVVQVTELGVLASIGPLSRPKGPPSIDTLPAPTTTVRLSLPRDPIQVPWSVFRDVGFDGVGENFARGFGASESSLVILGLLVRFGFGIADCSAFGVGCGSSTMGAGRR